MSQRIVIGTAGHIDHGKSRLVRALTGVDPDRLEEEQRRGITIDLGFGHLDLGDGLVAGLVDVPGHERFVRTMVAGASGIDLVLLVVAADEGVMPQTREHLDVCRLLGLERGVVALTKADLLPEMGEGWEELVRADLTQTLAGTFLADAPVVRVSAETGEGLEDLVRTLARVAAEAQGRPVDGPLFLPIDRAFSMRGFGTVVTGTLLSGAVAPGDEVSVAPDLHGERVRVRGVQVHGEAAERAEAGQRTAVNLAGLEKEALARGAVLTAPGAPVVGTLLDVAVETLPALDRPLKGRHRLQLHLGTAHTEATVVLLDRRSAGAGERALAQLHLAEPLAVLAGQRFILRGSRILEGRGRTVAGGRVLGLAERRRRPSRPDATLGLDVLADGAPEARLETVVRLAGAAGRKEAALPYAMGLPARVLSRLVQDLLRRREVILVDAEQRMLVHREVVEALQEEARARIAEHRERDPLSSGLSKEALRSSLAGPPSPRLFHRVLTGLADAGEVLVEGDRVRAPEQGGALEGNEAADGERLLALLSAAGITAPRPQEAAAELSLAPERVRALLLRLAEEGRVRKVKDDLFVATPALDALQARLLAWLDAHGEISTQEFKEMTGASRKHLIPLAEYFDRERVTLRVGDKRVRRGATPPRAAG